VQWEWVQWECAMTTLQLFAIILAIVVFGTLILDRLPKPSRHRDFTFEAPDRQVTFKIETVIEDDFEVTFVDDWQIDRCFSVYGGVVRVDDEKADDPPFGSRTGVKVGTLPNWFRSSRIGGMRVYEKGGCEPFVAFPFQIARNILEEVRRDPNQLVTLRFNRVVGKDGKVAFPIYSFELSKPFE
jgi:hypothetical protein